MRVGILTFHEIYNPGAFWQAYATVQTVRGLGHEPVVIDYTSPSHRIRPLGELRRLGTWRHPRYWLDRVRKHVAFCRDRKTLLPMTPRVHTHQELEAMPFDAVLVGSDIVWDFRNPRLGRDPVYFGEHLTTERLIAYSPSCGPCDVESPAPEFVARGLARFHALSVRDEKTRDFVRRVSGREALLLPDPTFALEASSLPAAPVPVDPPYLCVYAMDHYVSPDFIREIRRFARDRGLPVVAVGYRNRWADRNVVEAGPCAWLSCLKAAAFVATNTFHGTIFSLLLGKSFVTEMNSAIESKTAPMLKRLNLADRRFEAAVEVGPVLEADWPRDRVAAQMASEAAVARDYLRRHLQ